MFLFVIFLLSEKMLVGAMAGDPCDILSHTGSVMTFVYVIRCPVDSVIAKERLASWGDPNWEPCGVKPDYQSGTF